MVWPVGVVVMWYSYEYAGGGMASRNKVSNGPSGGQIMLIAMMLALWRMYVQITH